MKIKEVIENTNRLFNLEDAEYPVRLAYAINKNRKVLLEEINTINESKQNLIEKYCKKDEKGKPAIVDNNYQFDDKEKVDAEYKEFLETETEISIMKVSLDIVEKCDHLTLAQMNALDFMIE